MAIRIGINGACGRMATTVAKLTMGSDEFEIVSAFERQGHPDINKDYGEIISGRKIGVNLTTRLDKKIDVVVDFATPEATLQRLQECLEFNVPMVIGTTGFSDTQKKVLKEAAERIAILMSFNMAPGVNILCKLLPLISKGLGDAFSVEIVEMHHKHKKDAPSGTALWMAQEISSIGRDPEKIKFHSIRGGDIIGEHRIIFLGEGEVIEISHSARDRLVFAKGALLAAKFITTAPAGFYTMKDVFNIKM